MTNRLCTCLVVTVSVLAFASPVVAAVLNVNSLSDAAANDGACTLREAIIAANTDSASGATGGECAAGSGSDIILFEVAGTLQPASALPTITTQIRINGYSAPGASFNTLPLNQGTNASLTVEIDGVNAGNVAGLHLSGAGAAGSMIEGLVINNSGNQQCCAQSGIVVLSVSSGPTTIIRGNFIGTDKSGTQRRGKGAASIYVEYSSNIQIGSTAAGQFDPGSVNLISGASNTGIAAGSMSNTWINGNLIGTDASGTAAIPNSGPGISLDTVFGQITNNVVSGNGGAGIRIAGVTSSLLIQNNKVGTNAAGTGAVPNNFSGMFITENPNGTSSIQEVDINENLVAFNTCFDCSAGIVIGASKSTNTVRGVRLSRNRVYSNAGLEIDLGETNVNNNGLVFGITPNDVDDPDTGGNNFQNFPVLTSAIANGATVTIGFDLNSELGQPFTLEFFYTDNCDASNHGGAQTYLGAKEVSTNGSGDVSDSVSVALATTSGFITATATSAFNGTSEFSECLAVASDIRFKDGFENPVP